MAPPAEDNSIVPPMEARESDGSTQEKGSLKDDSPERTQWDEVPRRPTRGGSLAALSQRHKSEYAADGRKVLTQEAGYSATGYAWPSWKKWMLLSSIFSVQVSMNFNTSVFPNAISQISEQYGVSEQAARVCQMIFLVCYAFGCELWAPWSEEFGRWPVLQLSLLFVNIWQIPAALTPTFGGLIVARGLGGLSSAGGSVTLGMIADLFEPDNQQWAVLFVVFSSVFGTSIGPVVGGFVQQYLDLQWNFWIQLIFGVVVQAVHFFMPESRSTILLDKEAKRRRKAGEEEVWGPDEIKQPRISAKEFGVTWIRPFEMFLREPIVLSCSLLSGFSDALIFVFQEGFHPVYEKWGFGTVQIGLAFIPINVGYVLAYLSYIPWIRKDRKVMRTQGSDALPPEHRLYWLLYLAPFEFIGLMGFAWSGIGPQGSHWIAPMIFSCMIAIANFAIYMSTIDYMIAAYGPYSASATGGNGFARDFLAGISAMYSTPLYSNIGTSRHTQYASTILSCLAFLVTIPVYIIYWKGPQIREASKFAQSLDEGRKETGQKRLSTAPGQQSDDSTEKA